MAFQISQNILIIAFQISQNILIMALQIFRNILIKAFHKYRNILTKAFANSRTAPTTVKWMLQFKLEIRLGIRLLFFHVFYFTLLNFHKLSKDKKKSVLFLITFVASK